MSGSHYWCSVYLCSVYGPLTRYIKLRVAHAPGMPGTFSSPPRVSDPYMHHGTCVTHVPWYISESLTSGFHRCRWRGKRSRHSRLMRKPQFYVSGKRSMVLANDRIHYDLQVVFVCLQITPSHYHHYADSSEGIELIKCLSGTCCWVRV